MRFLNRNASIKLPHYIFWKRMYHNFFSNFILNFENSSSIFKVLPLLFSGFCFPSGSYHCADSEKYQFSQNRHREKKKIKRLFTQFCFQAENLWFGSGLFPGVQLAACSVSAVCWGAGKGTCLLSSPREMPAYSPAWKGRRLWGLLWAGPCAHIPGRTLCSKLLLYKIMCASEMSWK